MLYAILCYNDESAFASATPDDEAAIMDGLALVRDRLTADGRLGPSARLLPSTTAVTIRKGRQTSTVLDGPFAETKEQLLGFYIVSCESLEAALDVARELGRANPVGSYEIRPVGAFEPGGITLV